MISKGNFYLFFKGAIKRLFSFKKAIVGFTSYHYTAKSSLLEKVLNHHIFRFNKYFVILIASTCLIISFISYYEQNYQHNKKLLEHAISISFRINRVIEHYRESLYSLSTNEIWTKSNFLEDEISKTIKLSKNNYLTNVVWHPKNDLTKSFGIYGRVQSQLILQELIKNDLLHNSPKLFITKRYIDHNNQLILVMLMTVKDKGQHVYGYLSLPIELISLLDVIYDRLSDDEIIRIKSDEQTFYFSKNNKSFHLKESLISELYNFSENRNLVNTQYQIAIGVTNQNLIAQNLNVIYHRCIMLLALGGAMIFIYNLLEKQKLAKFYKKNFVMEVSILENKIKSLIEEQKKIPALEIQLSAYNNSNKIIRAMQIQVREGIISALSVVSKHNEVLIKHCGPSKEIELDIIENILTTTQKITKDLSSNVYSKNLKHSKIDINEVIGDIISLFAPITIIRSITIKKSIKKLPNNSYIKSNKLILQQIILNLIGRSIHSSMDDSIIGITLKKKDEKIVIHIVDEGLGVDEQLLKTMLIYGKHNLPISNFYIDIEIVHRLVIEMGGVLEVGKKTILSLPIDPHEYYRDNPKVIPFSQIPYWKQSR